ncbi:hypothetical protein [Vibrio vulnificus]|uniref:hypothetical protein n=1 Tax=Vibrio vulnificus TaxID=672 RepID=UPI000A3914E4|nr:hypothetical protein [Vibrio vulnificus]OUD76365.1 putative membrane protein [Vibrio vulnificus]
MDIDDLRVINYQEAVKGSQKSIYSGLVISVFTYFFGAGELGGSGTIPLLNLELTYENSTIYILSALYFYCGLLCSFLVQRATQIHESIENTEISAATLYFPCFINANNFYKTMLAGILFGVWYTVYFYSGIFEQMWKSVTLGALVSSPYFYSLKLGGSLAPKG